MSKFNQKFHHGFPVIYHHKKALKLVLALFILLVLPVMVLVSRQEQNIHQHAAGSFWTPSVGDTFQWQLTGLPIDESVDAQVYDIDVFNNDASVVASLHAQGRKVICYMSSGSSENWRPDFAQFTPEVQGSDLKGWAGEKWLDVRNIAVLGPIMQARLDLCKQKGFDGAEFDNVDGYSNSTGFPLTAQDQITYNKYLADQAHARGLSAGLKNDTGQLAELEPFFDWALNEECFQFNECGGYSVFINAGKAVFEVEYSLDTSQFCPQATAMHLTAMKKNLSLDAPRTACAVSTITGFPTPTTTTDTPSPTPDIFTSPIPSLTVTPQADTTKISLSLKLHGIGSGGDSVNPASTGNSSPLHTSRSVTVFLFDVNNVALPMRSGTVTYQASTGDYQGVVDIGTIATGFYTGKISTASYLPSTIPGIISLTSGQIENTASLFLISGDMDSDGKIDILDYNLLIDCYSDFAPARACNATKKLQTDLTDDGAVNSQDLNLFLRELSVRTAM